MKRTSFRDLRNQITSDPKRACRLEEARQRVLEEEETYRKTLAQLRRARKQTQAELAATLHVSQAQVSRIENQADLYLSTLANYVAALGGRLELVGVFDDVRVPLRLEELIEAAEPAVA